jgi:TonB family protein
MTKITGYRFASLLALPLAMTLATGPARAEVPADAAAELARARQLEARGGFAKQACEAYQHASDLAHGQSALSLLGMSGCFTRQKEGAKAVAAARQALAVAATPEERKLATTVLGLDLLRQPDEATRSQALALFQEQAAGPAKAQGEGGVLLSLLALHRDQEAAEVLRRLREEMSAADLQTKILNALSYPGPTDDEKQRNDFYERAYRLSPDVPLRVSGKITRPEIRTQSQPEIPTEAHRHRGFSGTVIVETIIDAQGKVIDIRVLKGQPMGLTESAVKSVKTWTFRPATLDGKPVKVYYVITVNFQITGDS